MLIRSSTVSYRRDGRNPDVLKRALRWISRSTQRWSKVLVSKKENTPPCQHRAPGATSQGLSQLGCKLHSHAFEWVLYCMFVTSWKYPQFLPGYGTSGKLPKTLWFTPYHASFSHSGVAFYTPSSRAWTAPTRKKAAPLCVCGQISDSRTGSWRGAAIDRILASRYRRAGSLTC